jgi:hypothetical protein
MLVDFLTKFARGYCADEAKRFLGVPPPREAKVKLRGARAQTFNKQTSNEVVVRINVSCCSRSDKLVASNKTASQGDCGAKAGLTKTMLGAIVMADLNLSPNRVQQRMLRHRAAVMTLARMRAKKAVLLALRAEGLRTQDFSAREIAVLVDYYLNQHRARLIAEAEEVIATWPEFARWRCPQEVVVKVTEIEHSANATRANSGVIANG